jgi:hypothetical protein
LRTEEGGGGPALARVPGCPDNARPRGPCCVRRSSPASLAAFTRR